MKKTIIELLEDKIISLLEELSMHEPGSSEFVTITKSIDDLYATLNKEKMLELDSEKLKIEEKNNEETAIREFIFNSTKSVVEVIGIIAPIVFYGVWMKRGLEFEKEGSFTSATFKGLINKFKPGK